ncbi:MAG: alpha-ketoacid dehydrogenase subunit beta [Chloroflexi bacterium]|jgi:pyruvate dehydrogenase E1 component beta subunit|nr:alpha-ketoacid dehydrogenase subunit beta [Chloroflexota bacterium]
MKTITYSEAIREALTLEMERDDELYIMGEDVGKYGGLFKVTRGLYEKFGSMRVIDSPLSESVIVGAGIGTAISGISSIVEIQFTDLLTCAMDQIVNNAAKFHYISNGLLTVPLVIRAVYGAGVGSGAHHSQSVEGWFAAIPGLKIVMPSTPYDAKGLLISSIRDPNPVLFLEHKRLYFAKGEVPEDSYSIPLGKAAIRREGSDVTIVATGLLVSQCLEAADECSEMNISVEVIDLRSICPLDKETILNSVKKTGRLIIVEEGNLTGGFAGEIAAIVVDEGFDFLDAPIKRVSSSDNPFPSNVEMELYCLPNKQKIIDTVEALIVG